MENQNQVSGTQGLTHRLRLTAKINTAVKILKTANAHVSRESTRKFDILESI